MIQQFIIADIMIKMGASKKTIMFSEATILIILYFFLLRIFYRLFNSVWILIAEIILLGIFFFVRLHYLRKYLNALK